MAFECTVCDRRWHQNFGTCLYCGAPLVETGSHSLIVIGVTEVHVPTPEHVQVPYYVLLLRGSDGIMQLKKSLVAYEVGAAFEVGDKGRQTLEYAVVGTGLLGIGLASFLVERDCRVILKSRSPAASSRAMSAVSERLAKNRDDSQVDRLLANLTGTTEYGDLSGADVIIEAVAEDPNAKADVLNQISLQAPREAMIATNTSSLSINRLAAAVEGPERFLGLHFFNPVDKMPLVEVIKGKSTSEAVLGAAIAAVEGLGKTVVLASDTPGFVVNRLLMPFINEAVRALEAGVATRDSIDQAVCLGLRHPMGPLALADLIGLDICVAILGELHERFGDSKYEPAAALVAMVREGRLGRKSGEGFYSYAERVSIRSAVAGVPAKELK